jgi:hypothetical protein
LFPALTIAGAPFAAEITFDDGDVDWVPLLARAIRGHRLLQSSIMSYELKGCRCRRV